MEENNININEEYKRLGIARIKKRVNLLKLFTVLLFILTWFIYIAIIIFGFLMNDIETILNISIMFVYVVPGLIVLFIFYIKNDRILNNEEKLINIGKKMYENKSKE